jgi:D-alanine-D-alanine ligase
MRILLIAGGWSPERAVSLSGARGVSAALSALGHSVTMLDLEYGFDRLAALAPEHDFAFLNLHGRPGEDGVVQAVLDAVGLPYQGTGPAGSFLALNKVAAKQLFVRHGLPTPAWQFLPARPAPGFVPALPLPFFVKPNCGGSSLGMHLVRKMEDLAPALDSIFSIGEEALLEEPINGQEVTCAVLGEQTLPPILILPLTGAGFFDYESKYTPKQAEEICPAPIAPELEALVRANTLAAHRALGLAGYSRGDFMVRDGVPYLLEMNTLPGMTETSLVPLAARTAGLDFAALIARLIELGLAQRGPRA